MNKDTAPSSFGRSDGFGASFPSHKDAGGGVAKGSPPAFYSADCFVRRTDCFLVRHIDGVSYVSPLQFIEPPKIKRPSYTRFTEDEDAFIVNSRVHGVPFSQIAKALNRGRGACIIRHQRLTKALTQLKEA